MRRRGTRRRSCAIENFLQDLDALSLARDCGSLRRDRDQVLCDCTSDHCKGRFGRVSPQRLCRRMRGPQRACRRGGFLETYAANCVRLRQRARPRPCENGLVKVMVIGHPTDLFHWISSILDDSRAVIRRRTENRHEERDSSGTVQLGEGQRPFSRALAHSGCRGFPAR